jgi:ribosomal protein S27AE
MPIWTCPNPKCGNDTEMAPDQKCPVCGKNAKEFNFSELGILLKEKLNSKKKADHNNKIKRITDKIKYCPRCGSTNIFWASGLPQLWSLWECKECN